VDAYSLSSILDEALRSSESRVERGATEVVVDLAPDLPALQADGNQLRQLFTNLFTNAFEALDHKGRLCIDAKLKPVEVDPDAMDGAYLPPTVVVSVADDGPGIPEELRDRIFSPFFTTKARGSGLGLAIVRKIVDAHDGRIDMVVGEHGGTCFRITLPVVASRELASPFAGDPLEEGGNG
jgi:signal transduction histidine kinase